jgi:glycosyltransferase involved in cell wall biosynthesis
VLDYYGLIDVFVVPRLPATVCHLVTPLKPFEAFSTGRTVVLSDVRALASIAEESGAAETFVAGDAGSLSEVLLRLLMEPGRRKELAATGAAWVRSKRTWSANASTYMELYRRLGALPLPAEPDHTHRN